MIAGPLESSSRPWRAPQAGWSQALRSLGALLLGCAWPLLPACDETGPRVYTAMAYDPATQCLSDYAPLGLVDADELPATCAPVCLTRTDTLYVSAVCPPYPDQATLVTPTDSADCKAALAALAAIGTDAGTCQEDAP